MVAPSKPGALDFFAGSGLVAEGLHPFFETLWANDLCPKKCAIFCANQNPDVFHLGSIEDVHGRDLPEALLSWSSFPCQDLSLAGLMKGLQNTRSGLFRQWLRVMDEMPGRPPLAVAENVVGLVSSAGGANYRALHHALTERGYRVGALLLDAVHWVPQSRKRIFVVAVDGDLKTRFLESDGPTWCHPAPVVRAAHGLPNWVWWNPPKPGPRTLSLESIIDFDAPCDPPHKRDALLNLISEKHRAKMDQDPAPGPRVYPGYKRCRKGRQFLELRFDGVAGCLRTPEGGSSRQFLVLRDDAGFRTRLLTLREAAALMGAPAGYLLPGAYNTGYKALGDAVAVPVTRFLAQHLLAPIAAAARETLSTGA